MKETKKKYYFDTYHEAEEFQKKHGGEIGQSILPGYITADTVFFIEKESITNKQK